MLTEEVGDRNWEDWAEGHLLSGVMMIHIFDKI